MQKQLKCPDCKQPVSSQSLKQHIIMCKSYVAKLLPNTMKLASHLTRDYLQFLAAQLDLAKETIISKLQQSQFQVPKKIQQQERKNLNQMYQMIFPNENQARHQKKSEVLKVCQTKGGPQQHIQDKIHHQNHNHSKEQQQIKMTKQQKIQQKNDKVVCQNCQKIMNVNDVNLFTYNESCFHLLCFDCLKSYILDQYIQKKGQLKCLVKGCKQVFLVSQIKQIMGSEQFDRMQTEVLRRTMSFTVCCKCKQQYQFVQGKQSDAPKVNQSGKKITKAQAQHYARNRFVCPNSKCKQQQCKICHSTPYHLGKSCQQNKQYKNSRKCRYCKNTLKKGYKSSKGITAFDDICGNKQCQKIAKNACSKIHSCGHSCFGYIRQLKCLPCLNQKCAKKQVKHDQNQESYCSICYTEDLMAAPCVMSKCGHIFHYSCLQKRLQIRWLTPRILFSFCSCPLCKQWIQLPVDCPLTQLLNKNKQLYNNLQQKSLKRLNYEKLQKDPKITDPKSIYYQKPGDYAMAIYAYFQCFKCKKPYFGGRKSCAQMMSQQNNAGPHTSFDAQKLICPQCCPVETKNCSKHGKQFLAFKCKFCCNIGLWFCWGSTHFCDDCHKRQQKGQYISKIPKEKLPKCEGKQKCPSGGDHGQNGAQFCLGCLLCRNHRLEPKQF